MSERNNDKSEDSEDSAVEDGENADTRKVRFYASFALCVPVPDNYAAVMASTRDKTALHTYRLSYKLLPTEDVTDIDVALFGSVAKIYCKDQAIALKVYEARGCVWIAWSKLHSITLNNEMLVDLFNHVCNVTVTSARVKARHDQPKGFRVSESFYESVQFMRTCSQWNDTSSPVFGSDVVAEATVIQKSEFMVALYEKLSQMSLKSVNIEDVPPWHEVEEVTSSSLVTDQMEKNPISSTTALSSESILINTEAVLRPNRTSFPEPPVNFNYKLLHDWIITKSDSVKNSKYLQIMDDATKYFFMRDEQPDENFGLKLNKKPPLLHVEPKRAKKQTLLSVLPFVQLKMQAFFSGLSTQVVQKYHPCSGIKNGIFLVHTDDELLSAQQKMALNPLTVIISQVEDLPELQANNNSEHIFDPVYLKYQILNYKVRRTNGRTHNTKNVVWNDKHTFLIGRLSPVSVREFFSGPPLIIEIHDRDCKRTFKDLISSKPSIFGTEPLDSKISYSAGLPQKIFLDKPIDLEKPCSMYGEAKLNLSEFLIGRTQLEFCEQVLCSRTQKRRQNAVQKYSKEVFSPDDIYLDAGTALEVRIFLSAPMYNHVVATSAEQALISGPYYSRLITTFSSSQKPFLRYLLKTIGEINKSEVLKNGYSSVICVGNSIPPFRTVEAGAQFLDIITGVHIFDKNMHAVCLEGEATGKFRLLLKGVAEVVDISCIKVLYNSAMIFNERLYLHLPSFVSHLFLNKPVKTLLNDRHWRFDTVRDREQCRKGLQNIHEIMYSNSLEEVTRNNLFPTVEMILSMNKRAGCMKTVDEIISLIKPQEDPIIRHFKPQFRAAGVELKKTPCSVAPNIYTRKVRATRPSPMCMKH